jgi:hypothetical protein
MEAHVKEYKLWLKAVEEWVKREWQGSKERVAEWEKDKIKKTPTLDRQVIFDSVLGQNHVAPKVRRLRPGESAHISHLMTCFHHRYLG